ncbi:Hypothetical_protein [Hexamita inflata]|uniref:Hypothetical_protein n=1 Tax=Hexamita inflata TaxID=28002 RepID=A0AA86TT17_9EUKA|nr:Hypothetical protein HINF_LOCUS15554 [Hexamita inflata]
MTYNLASIISCVVLSSLSLGMFMNWCAGPILQVGGFFQMLFVVVFAIMTAVSPFYIHTYFFLRFAFLNMELWRPSFIVFLGMFCFPCFQKACWQSWNNIILNIVSIATLVNGIVLFVYDTCKLCADKDNNVVILKGEVVDLQRNDINIEMKDMQAHQV